MGWVGWVGLVGWMVCSHFGSSRPFGSSVKTFVAHGPLSMSQPRRSAILALQRERAESQPVSIPLDDDTQTAWISVTDSSRSLWESAVPTTRCARPMLSILLLTENAFTMAWRGLAPFCRSNVSDAVGIDPVQSLSSSVVPRWSWRMSRTFSLVVLHGAICDAWPHVCQQLVRKFSALIALLSPATT